MAGDRTLKVVILGDASGARRAFDALERDSHSLGDKMLHLGKRAAQAFAVAAAGAGAAIFKVGTDYEQSLNVFESVSRASATTMDQVRAKAKALGADLSLPATSAADAASAMTELVKAGVSVNDTMAASKGVLQLAAAAQIDEAQAATITANALNAFGLQGKDAGRVADLLAASANASSGEITDMAAALSQASAVFAAAKVPVDDVTTAIGLLANKGIIGSDAGTSLRSMLLKLQSPSKEAAGTMSDLGIKIYDAQGRMNSMRDIVAQFTEKTKGLSQEQRDNALATIFGTDAVRAANIVLTGGVDAFDKMKGAVNRQGAAADVAAAKTKGLRGAIEGLRSQLETVAISIYEKVSPAVERFVRAMAENVPAAVKQVEEGLKAVASFVEDNVLPVLTKIGSFISDNVAPALAFFGVLAGGMVLAAVIALGAAIGALLSPFVLITVGLAAAVAGVVYAYNRFEVFRDVLATVAGFITGTVVPAIAKFADYLMDKLGDAVAWVRRMWPQISESVGHVMNVVAGIIRSTIDVVSALWRAWGDDLLRLTRTAFEAIRGTIDNVLQVIRGVIQTVVALINGDWGKAWDGIKQVLAGIWDQITNVVRTALDLVRSIIGGTMSTIAEIWRGAWGGIKDAGTSILRSFVDAFLGVVETIVTAAAKAFGWVPGIGPKMREAAKAVERFRDETNVALGGIKDKEVRVNLTAQWNEARNVPAFMTQGRPVPKFHGGGVFRAPTPGGEGLALLRDREMVLTPEQSAGGTTVVNNYYETFDFHVAGSVVTEQDLYEKAFEYYVKKRRRNGPADI